MAPDPRFCDCGGVAYVAMATDALVNLAKHESEPLVILRLEPDDGGGYELVLRRPSRAELEASIRDRFRT